MTQFFLKMTLNDFDLMTRLNSPIIMLSFSPFSNNCTPKSQQKINRNYYQSASYVTSPKESWGKSLHSAEKCCIFAPAIKGTAFCASFRSSIKTSKGHK